MELVEAHRGDESFPIAPLLRKAVDNVIKEYSK